MNIDINFNYSIADMFGNEPNTVKKKKKVVIKDDNGTIMNKDIIIDNIDKIDNIQSKEQLNINENKINNEEHVFYGRNVINDTGKKKIALCLFGISYEEKYIHWHHMDVYKIDWRKSVDNYREVIINYFERLGYEVDIYISTYNHAYLPELLSDYNCINFNVEPRIIYCPEQKQRTKFTKSGRNTNFVRVLELLNSNLNIINYEFAIITRFDLIFKMKFSQLNIDYNGFNVSMKCQKDPMIDDNLYVVGMKHFKKFYNICLENHDICFHTLKHTFDKAFGKINFMVQGNFWVSSSPIYQIYREHVNKTHKNTHVKIETAGFNPNTLLPKNPRERLKTNIYKTTGGLVAPSNKKHRFVPTPAKVVIKPTEPEVILPLSTKPFIQTTTILPKHKNIQIIHTKAQGIGAPTKKDLSTKPFIRKNKVL
jgi:hypothetical protein